MSEADPHFGLLRCWALFHEMEFPLFSLTWFATPSAHTANFATGGLVFSASPAVPDAAVLAEVRAFQPRPTKMQTTAPSPVHACTCAQFTHTHTHTHTHTQACMHARTLTRDQ